MVSPSMVPDPSSKPVTKWASVRELMTALAQMSWRSLPGSDRSRPARLTAAMRSRSATRLSGLP